jgi:predicted solute-binding protein
MLTLQTIDMWSDLSQAIVTFVITTEKEFEGTESEQDVVVLRNGDEALKFSPSYDDSELTKYAQRLNGEHT